ncbi:hypothetical protein JCGZ_25892 [Jatropha curcas]|uniref:Uncharacterized protein n=1 Tax=Jatropha curcas TaxID=180498 RepID=A0A067JDW8_JATCU|nr:hypothetical protein JCGZ_25892 [Jatropha curcas]
MRLRDLNEKAYTPQLVSIGPYHHGRKELKPMEEHKRRYLQYFPERSKMNNAEEVYVEELAKCVKKELDILQPLSDKCSIYEVPEKERKLNEKAYTPRVVSTGPLHHRKEELRAMEEHKRRYLLDFLQWSHASMGDMITCIKENERRLRDCYAEPIELANLVAPTITELHHAGVKIELHSSRNKLDIEFDSKKGILKIPRFKMEEAVEILLRNLQIFEECHFQSRDKYVNDYACMLAYLIRSDKDVEILEQRGILENWMQNNQAVATFLGSIDWNVNRRMFYFFTILEDLNSYCKNPWHKWNANLRQNYFNTPWAGISVAAAAFLLFLTIIQTVCSILQL